MNDSFIGTSLNFLSIISKTPVKSVDNKFKPELNESISIPKELTSLMEYLIENGKNNDQLFFIINKDEEEEDKIIDLIDTKGSLNDFKGSIHSVASVLVHFLESLIEPIIPVEYYEKVIYQSEFSISLVDEENYGLNKICLLYILSSLNILIYSVNDKKFEDNIIFLFSDLLLRHNRNTEKITFLQNSAFLFLQKELLLLYLKNLN
jgi:hypothetical protein